MTLLRAEVSCKQLIFFVGGLQQVKTIVDGAKQEFI